MNYQDKKVTDLKIAYIGGGSRGWAWTFMTDLALAPEISGRVYLYDIDKQAARDNEIIGNSILKNNPEHNNFTYIAAHTYEAALTGADFVIISIMPGTFDEMESDVHAPEKYGIYQSVGDTTSFGGIFRAMRTLPMFFEFAEQIKKYCPNAFVINYTNPMALCVAALYKAFPEIKAFGCCHEVFGTKSFLGTVLKEELGVEKPVREEVNLNIVGVNHFTWAISGHYKNYDIFPIYRKYCEKNHECGVSGGTYKNWMNDHFMSAEKVKMDLFLKFGYIAAAGDRHLAEFCPPSWYLKNPETVYNWGFQLTSVKWRKEDLLWRLDMKDKLISGEKQIEIKPTGEEGVLQIMALLGLKNITTNVNLPNLGQIPNVPFGAVVETNAFFSAGKIIPVHAGEIPLSIKPLIDNNIAVQMMTLEAAWERSTEKAYIAFSSQLQNSLSQNDSRELFDTMFENTKEYLNDYN